MQKLQELQMNDRCWSAYVFVSLRETEYLTHFLAAQCWYDCSCVHLFKL